jgi:hypothetical protein
MHEDILGIVRIACDKVRRLRTKGHKAAICTDRWPAFAIAISIIALAVDADSRRQPRCSIVNEGDP